MKTTKKADRWWLRVACAALLAGAACAGRARLEPDEPGEPAESEELETAGPWQAMEWWKLAWLDESGPATPERRRRAYEQGISRADSFFDAAGLSSQSLGNWVFQGPQNVGGRTRSLVIDPRNPLVLWAGSVGGGLWKSTDGGSTWSPAADSLPNLAVGSLALDPTNPDVMYMGTGEGEFNIDALDGIGLFKSTDAGQSWTLLAPTTSWDSVNRIAVGHQHPQQVLASIRYGGIARSTDGGTSWSNPYYAQGSFDVEFDPTDDSKAVAHIIDYDFDAQTWFHQAIYSTDGGASWHAATGLDYVAGFDSRIELAYAPSSPATVYALNGIDGSIWRSTDGGVSYQRRNGTVPANQLWYDNTLWVDPTNANLLVAGSTYLYRSTDGGNSTTQISSGYIITQQPHPDTHWMIEDPGFDGSTVRTVYVCNDGGIFRTTNIYTASTSSGWTSLNAGYATAQFYAGVASAGGVFIGGTQDNGSLRMLAPSSNATFPLGGDGMGTAIDPTDDHYMYYGLEEMGQFCRSSNRGLTSASCTSNPPPSAGANWAPPLALDPTNPERMWAAGTSVWRSSNVKSGFPPSWTEVPGTGGDSVSTIAIAPTDPDVVWVAKNGGTVYKTETGTQSSPVWQVVDDNGSVNPLPARYPGKILIDSHDAERVYVAFGGFTDGNLQRTPDGGVTWTDVTGSGASGLPAAPIRALAQHPNARDWIFAGTEVGVFGTVNGGATWLAMVGQPIGVSIDELGFEPGTTRLVAATHGRGMWYVDIPQLFADGFEQGDLLGWSAHGP